MFSAYGLDAETVTDEVADAITAAPFELTLFAKKNSKFDEPGFK